MRRKSNEWPDSAHIAAVLVEYEARIDKSTLNTNEREIMRRFGRKVQAAVAEHHAARAWAGVLPNAPTPNETPKRPWWRRAKAVMD